MKETRETRLWWTDIPDPDVVRVDDTYYMTSTTMHFTPGCPVTVSYTHLDVYKRQLQNIAEAFTTRDPDGNGKDDTYAMAVTKDLYSGAMGTEGFFAGYHSYPNMWMKTDDGTLAWGSVLPETKDALKALADMYAAGELDPEFGIKRCV